MNRFTNPAILISIWIEIAGHDKNHVEFAEATMAETAANRDRNPFLDETNSLAGQ